MTMPLKTHVVVIRDVRLKGFRPKGDSVLEVNVDTPISWPIAWAVEKAKKFGDEHFMFLRIMSHAYMCSKGSQGGCGIQFCDEDINLQSLYRFQLLCRTEGKRLFPYYRGIDLLGCGVAYITPGSEGKHGDGNILCSRMAQFTQSHVRSSTAAQTYSEGTNDNPNLDFGDWEGTVYTYGPKGDVVKVEQAPGRDTLPWGMD
jgi:hypothetical protein